MRIFSENVSGQIVVLVLAVEQQQVAKGLGREGVLLEQELQLAKPVRGPRLHVHQGLCAWAGLWRTYF